MREDIQSLLPLTPTVFHMLLALADGEKHGYGIMRAVEEETQCQMQIRTGSLYGSIRRMIEAGLIKETNERPDPELDDERRRYQGGAGGIGRLGLTLNVAGCVGMSIFLLASSILGAFGIEQHTWPNYVIAACFLTLMIGHVLFGIDAPRNKLLPRWNVMPLLVGLPSILLIVPDLLIDGSKPNHFELTLITTFLRFALTGACWVLLGMALMDQRREPQLTEAI